MGETVKREYKIGLSVDGERAVLVEVYLDRSVPTVVRVAGLTLPPGSPVEKAKALHRLLKEHKFHAREVSVCLPHRLAAIKSVRVPSTDPVEIRSMAILQACRLMPFSPEEIVAGYEPVESFPDGFSQILLTVVRREDVVPLLEICRGAGLRVKQIFLDSHALPSLVAESHESACLLVKTEEREGMVAAIDKNKPRFARTFPWDGSVDSLAREVELSLVAYQKEAPFWTPTEIVWYGGEPKSEFRKILESTLAAPLDVFGISSQLDDPLARTAYAAACAAHVGTNLLPEDEQKRQVNTRLKRQQKIFGSLVLSLVLTVVGIAWGRVHRQKAHIVDLEGEIARLSLETEGLEWKADRLDDLRRSGGRAALLDVLRGIQEALPSGVSLRGLSYERRGNVVLQGESLSLAKTLATVTALEKVGHFQKVELRNSDALVKNGKEIAQFQIVCHPVGRDPK